MFVHAGLVRRVIPYDGISVISDASAKIAMMSAERFANEIEHGRFLASGSPEVLWGWGTPAGTVRAKRRAEVILDGAQIGSGSSVLEIGCGTGLFTEKFAECGANILAVDVSRDLIELARERELPDTVRFLERNFEDCAVEGPFDAVIGSSVLHHLDLSRTWPKIFNLLKPGGRMSFAEPNMLNPQIYAERHFRRFFPAVSPDETAFTRSGLKRTLQDHGFRRIRITPFDWLHPATPPPLIGLVQAAGRIAESIWPVREFAGSLAIHAIRPE